MIMNKIQPKQFIFTLLLLIINSLAFASSPPAGDRIYMGAFTDRDWSNGNPCGDKVTEHWEWDQNKQWYGNTSPYFAKIFPEWFKPDGSANTYGNWKVEIERIKAQGRVPYINWEAHGQTQDGKCWHGGNNGNERVNRNVIAEINSGQHDAFIQNIAIGLRDEKTKIVMDLFHEMNGNWYDWSPCKYNTGWEAWRNAYKRVVNIFRENDAGNVEFGTSTWFQGDICGHNISETVANIHIDGYLDWIGVDIYGGISHSFSLLMDPWYASLANTGLPIVIGEMGVATPIVLDANGNPIKDDRGSNITVADSPEKRAWMTGFRDALVNKYPRIKAFNWFDIDKGWVNNEANYEIESAAAGEHFNSLMNDPRFVGAFGSFEIKSKFNDFCLMVSENSTNNSANIQSAVCNGSKAQIFTITDLGDFKIELRALNSDKCIDVAGGNNNNGANIQQYDCNASVAQIWTMNVIDWNSLEVELSASNSNKCLDLDINSGNIQQWSCFNSINQRWILNKTAAGANPIEPPNITGDYVIKNKDSGQCLDVFGGSADNGANVQTWACNGSEAQRISITDLGGFKLLLRSVVGVNKCLDVANISDDNGANVHQWSCLGGANQTWHLNVTNWSTMEVTLSAQHSGKCLEEAIDSRNIQQWTCSGQANQYWYLQR